MNPATDLLSGVLDALDRRDGHAETDTGARESTIPCTSSANPAPRVGDWARDARAHFDQDDSSVRQGVVSDIYEAPNDDGEIVTWVVYLANVRGVIERRHVPASMVECGPHDRLDRTIHNLLAHLHRHWVAKSRVPMKREHAELIGDAWRLSVRHFGGAA